MKKIIAILSVLIAFTVFSVIVLQTPSDILYLLNWGEYISMDMVAKFEKENNCQVVLETVTSSEAMYQKITSNTTSYDIAIPGDYVVTQLYEEGYLREADVTNTEYEFLSNYKNAFSDDLSNMMDTYMVNEKGEGFSTYYFPYFWGAYSMIYNEANPEVKAVIETKGFEALYNRSLYSSNVKIGMYDTARWIVASYLMSKGMDPNITDYSGTTEGDLSMEIQNDVINAIKTVKFDEFGNDSLKRNVATGSLDMCYTQLGDFFDTLYLVYDEANFDGNVDFNVCIPDTTTAFFDAMVIPTTCQNYELANSFINFMMNPDNAYENACAVGYSPTLKGVVSAYQEAATAGEYYYEGETEEQSLKLSDFLIKYPMYLNPLYGSSKAYMLEPKSSQYLTTCETIFNSLA